MNKNSLCGDQRLISSSIRIIRDEHARRTWLAVHDRSLCRILFIIHRSLPHHTFTYTHSHTCIHTRTHTRTDRHSYTVSAVNGRRGTVLLCSCVCTIVIALWHFTHVQAPPIALDRSHSASFCIHLPLFHSRIVRTYYLPKYEKKTIFMSVGILPLLLIMLLGWLSTEKITIYSEHKNTDTKRLVHNNSIHNKHQHREKNK